MDRRRCFACGDVGHIQKECPSKMLPNQSGANNVNDYCPKSDVPVIDTHCHVDYVYERLKYSGSFRDFRKKYNFPSNFYGCIVTFCDPAGFSSFSIWKELLAEDRVWGTFGVHPHNAVYYDDELEVKLIQCLEHEKSLAVGEMGLDYSDRCPCPEDVQLEAFKRQLRWAMTLGKPVVIHSRDAEEDVYNILKEILPNYWLIHLHCYTGTFGDAKKFMDTFPNLCFGITNLVTFPTALGIHMLAKEIPLNRIILETDAPYFVPSQLKIKTRVSHPGMVIYAAEAIAKLRGCSLDEVLKACYENTKKIYKI